MWELAESVFSIYVRTFPIPPLRRFFSRCRENNHPKPGTTSVLVGITSRHSGISGERPQAAVSDVGDPTERHAPTRLFAWRVIRRCSALGSDDGYVSSASPDFVDVTSCTPSLAKTAGRISANDRGPDPRFFWSRSSSVARAFPSSLCSLPGSWATATSECFIIRIISMSCSIQNLVNLQRT